MRAIVIRAQRHLDGEMVSLGKNVDQVVVEVRDALVLVELPQDLVTAMRSAAATSRCHQTEIPPTCD